MPWNKQTFTGYIGEFFYSMIDSEAYFFANGAFLLMFISVCLHHRAFISMFRHSIRELGADSNGSNDKKLVCKLIQLDVMFKK